MKSLTVIALFLAKSTMSVKKKKEEVYDQDPGQCHDPSVQNLQDGKDFIRDTTIISEVLCKDLCSVDKKCRAFDFRKGSNSSIA